MRIIAGRFKGRKITPPQEIQARPTTDFAKEALFNILQHSIPLEGIRVLDLFAGTGGISLEFLSRGAAEVVSVEADPALHAHMQRMARELESEGWHHVKADVFQYLNLAIGRYDVIFADPPFDMEATDTLPSIIREHGLLEPDGLLVVEHPKRTHLDDDPWFDVCRKYGKVRFSFFKPTNKQP